MGRARLPGQAGPSSLWQPPCCCPSVLWNIHSATQCFLLCTLTSLGHTELQFWSPSDALHSTVKKQHPPSPSTLQYVCAFTTELFSDTVLRLIQKGWGKADEVLAYNKQENSHSDCSLLLAALCISEMIIAKSLHKAERQPWGKLCCVTEWNAAFTTSCSNWK